MMIFNDTPLSNTNRSSCSSMNDLEQKLLNISYLKLQQIRFNKLSKRAIETPLNQSVIVWNFLKKLENLKSVSTTTTTLALATSTLPTTNDTEFEYFNKSMSNSFETNSTHSSIDCMPSSSAAATTSSFNNDYLLDWSNIITPPVPDSSKQTHDYCLNNSNDKENSYMDTTPSSITLTTTAIGSERRSKLINSTCLKKYDSEGELTRKRYKTLMNSTNNVNNHYESSSSTMDYDYDYTQKPTSASLFSLWSNTTTTNNNSSASSCQKSCSYEEHSSNYLQTSNYDDNSMCIYSFNSNVLQSSSSSSSSLSSSNHHHVTSNNVSSVESCINILIECE